MSDLLKQLARLSPEKRALLAAHLHKMDGPGAAPQCEAIAVIGMGCRFPGGANSPAEYWDLLVEGRDAIRDIPKDRWDVAEFYDPDPLMPGKMATRWGGFVDDIDQFDADFFGLTAREAVRLDPQQRMLLQTSWEAIEDAGLTADELAGSATGVFVGIHNLSSDYYLRQLRDRRDIDAYTSTGGASSIVANRLSYWLDLHGPSLAVDTACSSSLMAVHLAVESLRSGESNLALAGGVNLVLEPDATIAFSRLEMMASDGRCKTFDANADGFVRSEGCGIVLLKRLSDARRHGDPIRALIRGTAANQDGRTNGLTAPNGLAQVDVVRRALQRANVDPDSIGYIETHGTGTSLGDPIEVDALSEVFTSGPDRPDCVLGAVKTNIGHLEAAAGIAGLIKTVLCLRQEYIPRNLHFKAINPHIALEGTPFVVPTQGIPWPSGDKPRCAGVSSFGFGGTNAHAVLEEAPRGDDKATKTPVDTRHVSGAPLPLLMSARNSDSLRELAVAYTAKFEGADADFGDICFTASCRRTHHEHRLAVLASNTAEAMDALRASIQGEPSQLCWQASVSRAIREIAFVFSGQGPQRAGMGRELLVAEPAFRAAIERIDKIFVPLAGWSIREAMESGDEGRMANTDIAQPILFALQVGLAEIFGHYGIEPTAVVGHSVGEVAAAHVAGALRLEDAVRVIYHRARLMQQAHGRGHMAAVALSEEEARRLIEPYGSDLSVAAVNAPRSVTISGSGSLLEKCLETSGIQHRMLQVEYAFHSRQMEPLQSDLVKALEGIRGAEPRVALYSTVRGGRAEAGDFTADYWADNIRSPVLFAQAADAIASSKVDCFIELSPHPVLTTSLLECQETWDSDPPIFTSLRRDRSDVAALRASLAELHTHGARVDWSVLFPEGGKVVALPRYPWQRGRYWFDARRTAVAMDSAGPDVRDWFYSLEWLLRSPGEGFATRPPADWTGAVDVVAAVLRPRVGVLCTEHDAGDARELLRDLDKVSVQIITSGLRELGFSLQTGDHVSAEEVAAPTAPHLARLLNRLFEILAEEKIVEAKSDGWSVCRSPADANPATELKRIRQIGPEAERIAGLLERCGARLADVIRGRHDPLSLLFPDGAESSAEWVYAHAPFARVANALVGEAVQAVVEQLPDTRTLRILELGAGTGATTKRLLPALPADRTEYVFTDVSRLFLSQAQQKFGDSRFVRYEMLDLERDPDEQGFAGQQFDVIVASNVLHATADLTETLQHARKLLTPGGVMVTLEGTARRRWTDLTFGLMEGWWRFSDEQLRPSHPLISRDEWLRLLADNGFADVTAIDAQPEDAGSLFAQSILIARNAPVERLSAEPKVAKVAASPGPWLVVSDHAGVGKVLAGKLHTVGTVCQLVELTSETSDFSSQVMQVESGNTDAFTLLLDAVTSRHGGPPEVVVHIGGSDETLVGNEREFDWDASMTRSCGSAMLMMQALHRSERGLPGGFWIVTRGAQLPRLAGGEIAVAQAPLWGLGRVVARELPDLWGGLIDLDFDVDTERDALALMSHIGGRRDEGQIALRAGDRFVARLVPLQQQTLAPPTLHADRSYLITGGLGELGLQLARWLVANGARNLTLTGRSALQEEGSHNKGLQAVRAMEAQGATVRVISADVADYGRMAEIFASFGNTAPALAGILHVAGVMEFESFETLGMQSLLDRSRAKVAGSWNLHQLSRDTDLDFLVFYSSASALGGSPGLSHYAAANQFLDTLAHYRRQLGLPALSVNWGLWAEGRAQTAERQQSFDAIGLRGMPSDVALSGLGGALTSGLTQCTIADIDWSLFKPIYESRGARTFLEYLSDEVVDQYAANSVTPRESIRDRIVSLPPDDAIELLETTLRGHVAAVLSVPAESLKGRHDGFFQMGMDSIMTVELRRRLESTLSCKLPTTVAFEYPTIDRLTQFIAVEVLGLSVASEPVSDQEIASVESPGDDGLDEMSSDELREILDRELLGFEGSEGSASK